MKQIHSLPHYQRPREKLKALGTSNLTTVELLALLLGSGTKKYPVMTLAEQLHKKYPLSTWLKLTVTDLTLIPGVGYVQASRVIAALELGRRLTDPAQTLQIFNAEDAVAAVQAIRTKNREYLVALYLNARNEVVHQETLTIGGLNFNSLEPRDVFAPALTHPCVGVILAHNHPSGDVTPSHDDQTMTKELIKAGKLLGIRIVDHLVVSGRAWRSILAPPPHTGAHGHDEENNEQDSAQTAPNR